jgi:hypothetical protein
MAEDEVATVGSPEVHHHIGRTENHYEDIGVFIRRRQGNPAVTVSAFH